MTTAERFILFAALIIGLSLFAVCTAGAQVVVFDQAHGQRFTIDNDAPLNLSGLAKTFRREGFTVRAGTGPITDESLGPVGVLVVSGAFKPFSSGEIGAILRFLERGGRLCVMIHVPFPLEGLFDKLGILFSNAPLREREGIIKNNPGDFVVTRLAGHPVTKGIKRFSVYGCWALRGVNERPHAIAQTSAGAWVDLNRDEKLDAGDAVQPFAVVLAGEWGKGSFIVFGDDAIFQNVFLRGENKILAQNLVKWIATAR